MFIIRKNPPKGTTVRVTYKGQEISEAELKSKPELWHFYPSRAVIGVLYATLLESNKVITISEEGVFVDGVKQWIKGPSWTPFPEQE